MSLSLKVSANVAEVLALYSPVRDANSYATPSNFLHLSYLGWMISPGTNWLEKTYKGQRCQLAIKVHRAMYLGEVPQLMYSSWIRTARKACGHNAYLVDALITFSQSNATFSLG